MGAVPRHGHLIGALHRCHSVSRDITGLPKNALQKSRSVHIGQ